MSDVTRILDAMRVPWVDDNRYGFLNLFVMQWIKIAVRTNLTGSVELTNSAPTTIPQHFYRALAP